MQENKFKQPSSLSLAQFYFSWVAAKGRQVLSEGQRILRPQRWGVMAKLQEKAEFIRA